MCVVPRWKGFILTSNGRVEFMESVSKKLKSVFSWFDLIGGYAVLIISLLIVLNVILRAAINVSIYGSYEYVCYTVALIVSLGLANCAINDGHVNVTFLVDKFPEKAAKINYLMTSIISLIFFILITWKMIEYAIRKYFLAEISIVVGIPIYIIVLIIAFGFLMLTLSFINKLTDIVGKGKTIEQ